MSDDLVKKTEGEKEPKPEVGPDFEDVLQYATTREGYIDISKMEELEGRYAHLPGRNRRCDVLEGPCACGAWH